MSLLTTGADWSVVDKSDAAVTDYVSRILQLTRAPRRLVERRGSERTPFPHLIELTPIGDNDLVTIADPITVVGKHLAYRGLDFFHTEVLSFKRAIVTFDHSLGFEEHFVLNLSWCRFRRPGWYDSGGRFTHIVTPEGTA